MKKSFAALIALSLLASHAAAHEVWIERDGAGPARVYLGEPADPVPEAGDPEFSNLKTPGVFLAGSKTPAALVRRANHIEAAIAGEGDVRLTDDNVFAPWENDGKWEGVIYYARAGRSDPSHALDLEIVPVAAGSDSFIVHWQGKPLPAAKVNVINADHWQKSFTADGAGRVDVPVSGAGRYLLAVSHDVEGERTLGGKTLAKTIHVSTLTFVEP
ncbi:DUF4198 domain-containing protein [Sphingopyxis macrogoltabida]|uniref:Nickel uptake transporter family protein n=1 Tax=Sphingopyxis macrogoltabida TaxID=33050 RepID=A0A0N9UDD7_SPHMC|nr:DUF4198 domain-containing protein [Sphingopyxis macrogoltabida]ALH81735.1 nickel uptake transporter family protein [Sphingopyxis macrogoltabida]